MSRYCACFNWQLRIQISAYNVAIKNSFGLELQQQNHENAGIRRKLISNSIANWSFDGWSWVLLVKYQTVNKIPKR